MKRRLVLGGAIGAAALVAAPVAALAAPQANTGGSTAPVTCQTTRWISVPVVAATPTWRSIDALTTGITAIYPVTVIVSGVVQGNPVLIHVTDRWIIPNENAQPGQIRVAPVDKVQPTPFSFTWVATGSSAAPRGHSITVDWRLAGPGPAGLVGGVVVDRYTTDVCRD